MNPSTKTDPASDYLLQQFDAIQEFSEKVEAAKTIRTPYQVKYSYYLGVLFEPDLLELCRELEEIVPLDHPHWIYS